MSKRKPEKQRAMNDTQYEQYMKSHAYAHPLEEEQAKVKRELADLSKRNRRDRAQMNSQLSAWRANGDVSEWEDDQEDDAAVERRKIRGNARTHKDRLKSMRERK